MSAGLVGQAASHFLRAKWRWRTLRGARLHAYQEQRAQRIIDYAQQNSPFYRNLWRGHNLDDWRTLPTVDKAAMMANFDTFNTHGIGRAAATDIALHAEHTRDFQPTIGGLTVGLSSGTSGHRGLFLVSQAEQAAWAGVILARVLHRLPRGRLRVAFFLRSHSNLYAQASGLLIDLRYFDLMTPLPEAVTALNLYQPQIIVAPPSLLGFLAGSHTTGALRVHPDRLISVAEVLEPQDRDRLSTVFQAPVHEIYQCTEGVLAISCAHGSLHIQEDIVALQCESLPPAPAYPLTPSSIRRVTPIITDLWRRTQPIIRYRLNDVLQLDDRRCTCGNSFRVLAAIEGRQDDVCYFVEPAGGRRAFFPDTIRRMVLLSDPAIVDYQAIQVRDGHLCLHLAVTDPTCFATVAASVRANVTATVAAYGCHRPDLQIEQGLAPTPPGSKRRRVQRLGSL